MNEMSIIHEIAETVSQYEEELLFDVESHHHEYTLEYDEENNNMSLLLKESYYTEEYKWGTQLHHYRKISYNTKHVRRHINHNTKIGTKHILKVQPQVITPI